MQKAPTPYFWTLKKVALCITDRVVRLICLKFHRKAPHSYSYSMSCTHNCASHNVTMTRSGWIPYRTKG